LATHVGPELLALLISLLIAIPAWGLAFVALAGFAATAPVASSPGATETPSVATPVAGPTGSLEVGPTPSPNAGLLRIAIVLDGRISDAGGRLKTRLDEPGFNAEAALYELRLLNGVATDGLDVADRLAGDLATATIGSRLGAAYRDLRAAAEPALRVAVDATAIKDAGRAVVEAVLAISPITDAMTALLAEGQAVASPSTAASP
jgi:hypothetical protein